MKCFLGTTILSIFLAGCSSNREADLDNSPSEIYAFVQKDLHKNNYKGAIKSLLALNNRYPFGPYAQPVQLNLIYAYYKSANFPLAKSSIDRFLHLNPTHPNVDYVLYIRGLTNMELDESALQKFFGIDRSDRNPEHALAAFHDFTQLIRGYPKSQYAVDARKRLIYLKERLAKHELFVIKYYDKRGAYIAVVRRVEKMLCDFHDTLATRMALPFMEHAYRKLQLNDQADKVMKIIEKNPV